MFERRISTLDAAATAPDVVRDAVQALVLAVDDFALAGHDDVASQQDFSAFTPQSLAQRYAAANSIIRRRFDAILRETETSARAGVALIVGRAGRDDRSTISAARFLGKSVAASLRKLDGLLAPRAG